MRPKVFIGSSVEGLSVAYAIQQNLNHDAELTVWSQGAFELSGTTIETLVEVTERSDFGIFVFTPDDITLMRGKSQNSVRDNVIFELGMFIGKLGRKRTFIVIPDKTEIHIPTDLLGVTPGKYDPNRTDNNLEAATGPSCNAIRLQIKKMGNLNPVVESSSDSEEVNSIVSDEDTTSDWFELFSKKDYKGALIKLQDRVKAIKGDEKKSLLEAYQLYSEFMIDENKGLEKIDTFLSENGHSPESYVPIINIFLFEDYVEKALETVEKALSKFGQETLLILMKAKCLKKNGQIDEAISLLESEKHTDNEDLNISLSKAYEEKGDLEKARWTIHKAYLKKPNSEELRFKYAKICLDVNEHETALFLLDKLTSDFPDNSSYWGYLSNACVGLSMRDQALVHAKKANELVEGKESWLLGNIGNIYNNSGLPSNGIKYLRRSLDIDNDSEYSHDRLATAIKMKEEEKKVFIEHTKIGRKNIREFKLDS